MNTVLAVFEGGPMDGTESRVPVGTTHWRFPYQTGGLFDLRNYIVGYERQSYGVVGNIEGIESAYLFVFKYQDEQIALIKGEQK